MLKMYSEIELHMFLVSVSHDRVFACVLRRANEVSRLRYESFHVKNIRTMINLISLS